MPKPSLLNSSDTIYPIAGGRLEGSYFAKSISP